MVTSAGRRRGTRYWVGLALVLTGVSTLSWAGWQFYGTNLVAQGKHEQAVSDIRERMASRSPRLRAPRGRRISCPAHPTLR
jgi:hypothetical protein